jgi:SAM-dependent methyltransferase
MERDRSRSRALQAEFAARGDELGWFDALYREAAGNTSIIPWADLAPRPQLIEWHRRTGQDLHGRSCLVVGCGLGDDAAYLARQGGLVTAFDVSPAAVQWCRRRFPELPVTWVVANLLLPPAEWCGRFDLVLEVNTLQTMADDTRRAALPRLAGLVAPGGILLVICRGREATDSLGERPWPLTRADVEALAAYDLPMTRFDDALDAQDPPVRRFVVEYHRPRPAATFG